MRKGPTGFGKLFIQTLDGRYHCEFSKVQLDVARTAVTERMSAQLES